MARQGLSLVNKALGLGMATALLVLAVTDVAFFSVHAVHIARQWDSMYDTVVGDWARMCERALSSGQAGPLRQQAGLILVGPMKVDYAMLTDARGKILAHSDPKRVGRTVDGWKGPSVGRPPNEKSQAVRLPDGGTAWAVVGYPVPSEADVLGRIRRQRGEMLPPVLLANALILILISVVSIVIARTIIRPVKALGAAVRRVSEGDLKAEVRVSGNDELSALEQDFNAMARRLSELDELKSDFLAKITHDLRNPLGAIRGHAELLRMELKGPLTDAQQKSVGSIMRSTDFLAGLVNNILDMTTIEAGRMQYVKAETDVAEIVAAVAVLMRAQAEQYEVALVERLPGDLPRVAADPQALRRVVINLVSNALKFTPKGGTVTVEVERSGSGVSVAVRDTGIGIPADKAASLFAKFSAIHQAKDLPRPVLGTGLGLAICKEIVEAHSGRISVRSAAGQGTVFEFTLPGAGLQRASSAVGAA